MTYQGSWIHFQLTQMLTSVLKWSLPSRFSSHYDPYRAFLDNSKLRSASTHFFRCSSFVKSLLIAQTSHYQNLGLGGLLVQEYIVSFIPPNTVRYLFNCPSLVYRITKSRFRFRLPKVRVWGSDSPCSVVPPPPTKRIRTTFFEIFTQPSSKQQQ